MSRRVETRTLPDASDFIEAVKKLAQEYDVELVRCTATDKHGTSSFTRFGKEQNQTMARPSPVAGFGVFRCMAGFKMVQVSGVTTLEDAQEIMRCQKLKYPENKYTVIAVKS